MLTYADVCCADTAGVATLRGTLIDAEIELGLILPPKV
jgi:hypothetical protein